MAQSILLRLFFGFIFVSFLFLMSAEENARLNSDISDTSDTSSSESQPNQQASNGNVSSATQHQNTSANQSIGNTQAEVSKAKFMRAYKTAIQTSDANARLTAIRRALDIGEKENVAKSKHWQALYRSAAKIHRDRWHFHYAIENLIAAQKIGFTEQDDKELKRLRKHLARIEKERNFNTDYIATRNNGPARKLQGKILVAYVFIDDGIKTRWGKKTIEMTTRVMSSVQAWKKRLGEIYSIEDIHFENKTFIVRRNPRLKQLASVSLNSGNREIEAFVKVIAQSLGEKSLSAFIQRELGISGADEAVVIFHSNLEERSFARRCGFTHERIYYEAGVKKSELISRCKEEFVMLMSKVENNRWDKLHYTQAHEMLHVFGADDLYSISGAANYALTDIMNFQSRNLIDSDIHPVTAYAIGWTDKKPKAPFNILDK